MNTKRNLTIKNEIGGIKIWITFKWNIQFFLAVFTIKNKMSEHTKPVTRENVNRNVLDKIVLSNALGGLVKIGSGIALIVTDSRVLGSDKYYACSGIGKISSSAYIRHLYSHLGGD